MVMKMKMRKCYYLSGDALQAYNEIALASNLAPREIVEQALDDYDRYLEDNQEQDVSSIQGRNLSVTLSPRYLTIVKMLRRLTGKRSDSSVVSSAIRHYAEVHHEAEQ